MKGLTAIAILIMLVATVGLTVYLFMLAQNCPGVKPPEIDPETNQFVTPEDYVPQNDFEKIALEFICGEPPEVQTTTN